MNVLRDYRTKNHMTQRALAELVGVERVTVARWESGKRKIGKDKLVEISEKTKISKRDLRPDLAELLA
jgi:transcriptional regulator with XRE-family HTH domain